MCEVGSKRCGKEAEWKCIVNSTVGYGVGRVRYRCTKHKEDIEHYCDCTKIEQDREQ